jgi:hypothetical protein
MTKSTKQQRRKCEINNEEAEVMQVCARVRTRRDEKNVRMVMRPLQRDSVHELHLQAALNKFQTEFIHRVCRIIHTYVGLTSP